MAAHIQKTAAQVAQIILDAERHMQEGGGAGGPGENGATFTPKVDSSGNLSWTNDKGLPNPSAVNIKGPAGTAYKTPVKGTDYWTAADKQSIVNDVLAALPAAEGVGF